MPEITETEKAWAQAAIELIIEHLRITFVTAQNFRLSEKGLEINVLLAANSWNLKKILKKLKE